MASRDTKTSILDAAEHLFAEQGFEGTSLRAITAAAGANLAAVHYHFGSKDALAKAVLARHIEPLNARRLAMLDEARQRAGAASIPLDDILLAFLVPALEAERSHDHRQACRLLGRIWGEQPGFLQELILEHFAGLAERFLAELARTLPHLGRRELLWRLHFLVGALVRTMQWGEQLEAFSGGLCRADDSEEALEQLVAFARGGFASGTPAETETTARVTDPHRSAT